MEKILVINMNYLGDALMTTPAHAALRRAYPNATIDAIAGAQTGYGAYDILAGNPDIDNLIVRATGNAMVRSKQMYHVLKAGKYDGVIVLPPILAYRVVAMLSLTKTQVVTTKASGRHMTDTMLKSIAKLVDTNRTYSLVLNVPAEARHRAEDLLPPRSLKTRLVGVNVGASRPQKRWPVTAFASLVNQQVAAGRKVVLLGGDSDDDRAAAAELTGAANRNVVDLVGKTTIMELAAVIERCDVLVTADTGAMHIASALGTPLVAIFGSTDPAVTGPYGSTPAKVLYRGLKCAPCHNHPTCDGRFPCLTDITPDMVGHAVTGIIHEHYTVPMPVHAN